MEIVNAIIVAAGAGTRMGGIAPKQFIEVNGKTILEHTLETFIESSLFNEIIIAVSEDYLSLTTSLIEKNNYTTIRTCLGGKERFHTVQAALNTIENSCQMVFIHDAVRPFCKQELLVRCFEECTKHDNAIPAIPLKDSIRMMDDNGLSQIVDRSNLRSIQTPQVFDYKKLLAAYNVAFSKTFTDDASVYEAAKNKIHLVKGESTNIKLTTPDDLEFARLWL